MAEELRASGKYDIFRGQTQDWPMRSSFNRLDARGRAAAQERLMEFAGFVHETAELEAMRGDRSAVFAVAQHYGIPTVLVDFTTEPAVAGWFATDGDPPEEDRQSVIYMARVADLQTIYGEALPDLYPVAIDVANLWRLQAQAGLFIHLPFEDVPELDKWLADGFGSIRFPYSATTSSIPRAAIYPDRRSRLEVLFDGFLSEERKRQANKAYERMGLGLVEIPADERLGKAPSFRTGGPPPVHPSWSDEKLAGWAHPEEEFRRVDQPARLGLEFEPTALETAEPAELAAEQARVVEAYLSEHPDARLGPLDVEVALAGSGELLTGRRHPDSREREPPTVGDDLAYCWDGMRRLPYSDRDLAQGLAFLATIWACVHGGGRTIYALHQSGTLLELGLARGGQHGHAFVETPELKAALRSDLPELLLPERLGAIDKPTLLLHEVNQPQRLFDLDRLVSLFARRIVPGQFVMRRTKVILFSPARLERLGWR